ncbi:MAG: ubiquinol-cytochrome c reductase iron-sulfur subunit [Pirellulales bacterium]
MSDKKKMSVAEILAAARAQKGGDAAPASPPAAEAAGDSSAAAPAPAAPKAEQGAEKPAAKPAVKPGGAGMSVADILAAARRQKEAGGEAAPAAEKPAPAAPAEKPAAAPKAAAKPKPAEAKAGEGKATGAKPAAAAPAALDTASILAAARTGSKPGPVSKSEAKEKGIEAPVKKKLEAPPMPAKPEYAQAKPKAASKKDESRRGFFASVSYMIAGSSLALGFTSLAVTHLLWVLGLARYMFPNILTEPPTKFKVGFPDTLAPGQVDERFKAQFGVWVVKHEYEGQTQIFALKTVCTHLGCTPNWLEAEQKFKCPCHGSGFYKDGVNFEGPAPRPLERYAIRVADDGQLEVDKSRVYHEETGQWKDPSSFVPA